MPKDYVKPNVNDDLQNRLQSITQQILSRTRLLHIIDQTHPYAGERKLRSPDELVERMRKDIEVELVRDTTTNQITAFNVYYSSRDPQIAQQVTSELTNLFINENLEEYDGTTAVVRTEHVTAEEIEFLRWRAERWMKVRHMRAVVRASPRFVLRNWRTMLTHTFRGGSFIKALFGLEDERAVFARYRAIRKREREYV